MPTDTPASPAATEMATADPTDAAAVSLAAIHNARGPMGMPIVSIIEGHLAEARQSHDNLGKRAHRLWGTLVPSVAIAAEAALRPVLEAQSTSDLAALRAERDRLREALKALVTIAQSASLDAFWARSHSGQRHQLEPLIDAARAALAEGRADG